MRRTILLLLMTMFCMLVMRGQSVLMDQGLRSLVDAVVMLRQAESEKSETLREKASETLEKNQKWTLMDELKDRNGGECLLTKKMERFRLVPVLNTILAKRYGKNKVKGHYLNGEDPKFNYSLIEKGIKAKGKVVYHVRGRVGHQDFVMVPRNVDKANLRIRMLNGKKRLKAKMTKGQDGNIYVHTDSRLKLTDQLTLEITNGQNENAAVVIINHNTRK